MLFRINCEKTGPSGGADEVEVVEHDVAGDGSLYTTSSNVKVRASALNHH